MSNGHRGTVFTHLCRRYMRRAPFSSTSSDSYWPTGSFTHSCRLIYYIAFVRFVYLAIWNLCIDTTKRKAAVDFHEILEDVKNFFCSLSPRWNIVHTYVLVYWLTCNSRQLRLFCLSHCLKYFSSHSSQIIDNWHSTSLFRSRWLFEQLFGYRWSNVIFDASK